MSLHSQTSGGASCGFARHLLHRTESISLRKVSLNTEYSGTIPLYVQCTNNYRHSPSEMPVSRETTNYKSPSIDVELCTFNHGIHVIIIDVVENKLDHNALYVLPYLKTLKPKTVILNQTYFENDIIVGIYYYLDFIKEYGFKFPCQYLYVLSGVPDLENAYWNGSYLTFGNGKYGSSKAAVSPLIVGHELTHALIQAGPKLEYYSQSGAINESLADIFGINYEYYLIEKKKQLGIGWEVGNEVYFDGHSMRSFKDPNYLGMPASIRDPLYYNGHQDNQGVHINSSVINHLFYQMQLIEDRTTVFEYFIELFHKLKYNSKFDDVKRILLEITSEKIHDIIYSIL